MAKASPYSLYTQFLVPKLSKQLFHDVVVFPFWQAEKQIVNTALRGLRRRVGKGD